MAAKCAAGSTWNATSLPRVFPAAAALVDPAGGPDQQPAALERGLGARVLDEGVGHGTPDAHYIASTIIAVPMPPPMQSDGGPATAAAGLQRVDQRREDPRPARADRMAQRDRAAVDVDLRGIELQLPRHRQRLRRERLVQFEEIELAERQVRAPGAPSAALRPVPSP